MHSKIIGAAALLFAVESFGGALDTAWIQGVTDKDPLAYRPGEKMVFTLTVQDLGADYVPGSYDLDVKRTGDDGVCESKKVPLTRSPFVYETSCGEPGFVRLEAYVVDKSGKRYQKKFTGDATTPEGKKAMNAFERQKKAVFFDGGAGADVETLKSHPEPKDFDEFWKRQYARLDRVPIKADLIPLTCNNPGVRLYAASIACAGLRPVTGYLSVPTAVDEGKTFPCRLETHGYSGNRCTHFRPYGGRTDEIVLNMNAHGLKLVEFGATDADTKALRSEIRSRDRDYAFDPIQNADPETAYFNGMVLRVKRGLQYLKTVKGWNGRDLYASGGSQGGLQTIWAAGCGEGVTKAFSGITWCCDMYGNQFRLGKNPGNVKKLPGDGWYILWTEALGYYDSVNFAKRIPKTCFTEITRAGLGDYCCPPKGLAMLWNNMTCPKKATWVQGSEHGYVPPKNYPGRDTVREAK